MDVHANILLAVRKGAPFRGLSSTLKAYLKRGAPFYNALISGDDDERMIASHFSAMRGEFSQCAYATPVPV
jgi:hypothetical protein